MNNFDQLKDGINKVIFEFAQYQIAFEESAKKLEDIANSVYISRNISAHVLSSNLNNLKTEFNDAISIAFVREISMLIGASGLATKCKDVTEESQEAIPVLIAPTDHRETLKLFKKPRTKVNKDAK